MDAVKIGEGITYLRKRAGYTQKDLADRIGISDKAVSKWERGQGLPDIAYLRKLSILLDTDTDSLLTGDLLHRGRGWSGLLILDENKYGIGAGTIIYDKPLLFFLLGYFLLMGIRDIRIICDREQQRVIREMISDGTPFGISITCFQTLEDAEVQDLSNIMVVYGRCILYGVDQTRFFQKAMIEKDRITILALPKRREIIRVGTDRRIVEHDDPKALRTQYDYSKIPVLFIPGTLFTEVKKRGSIEAFLAAHIDETYVEMMDRGFVEIELEDWDNVQDASSFLKIVQDKCGMNIYCLEEIAWRRGFIDPDQLEALGRQKAGTEYGNYILSICDRMKNE